MLRFVYIIVIQRYRQKSVFSVLWASETILKSPDFIKSNITAERKFPDNSITHTHLNLHAFSNNKSQLFLYLIKVKYI